MAQQSWRDLKTLAYTPAMLRVAMGIMFFWTLGALAHLNIDQFVFEGGGGKQTQVAPLLAALVIGIGVGSVLAGVWSAGRVELGILPLGAPGLDHRPVAAVHRGRRILRTERRLDSQLYRRLPAAATPRVFGGPVRRTAGLLYAALQPQRPPRPRSWPRAICSPSAAC